MSIEIFRKARYLRRDFSKPTKLRLIKPKDKGIIM
jgi:hypothetical protein